MGLRRHLLVLALLLLGASLSACRGEIEGEGETRTWPACRDCQDVGCGAAATACAEDAACAACIDTPFALDCVGNEKFRNLAACSCSECATECEHMCPAGRGACQSCGINQCNAEATACSSDTMCIPCLSDPSSEGCDVNTSFDDFLACGCQACGQECVWACPEAISACASCAVSTCADAYGECLQDDACAACADNPSIEGCEDIAAFISTRQCVCGGCEDQCGILFQCG